MTIRSALAGAALLALPLAVPAGAQPVEGFYVGAGAGVNWLQQQSFSVGVQGFPGNGDLIPEAFVFGGNTGASLRYDLGFGGVLALGYGFGNGLRAEVEGSFRSNALDRIALSGGFAPGALGGTGGSASTYGVMLNALFDVELGWPVVPYVGGGVGWMWHSIDRARGTWPAGPTPETAVTVDGTDSGFAYQAIAGLALPIADVPGLSLTAEYRFLGTLRNRVRVTESFIGDPGPPLFSGTVRVNAYNHSLFLGVRYAFGAAPVVPAPPAALPEPPRTFLVFFDWDRDTLTDRARQIVADAAATSRRVQTTRIEVSGHADRSGSPQYNQGLSQRRANTVAAELVRLGVPRTDITIQAFGESRPLVPTADGVREPQNRRVEIVLR